MERGAWIIPRTRMRRPNPPHRSQARCAEMQSVVRVRVASAANPADAPSRGDFSFLVDWVTMDIGGPFRWFDSIVDPAWAGLW